MTADGKVDNVDLKLMVDTGASISFMALNTLKEHWPSMELGASSFNNVSLASNSGTASISGAVRMNVSIADVTTEVLFHVMEDARHPVILGNDALEDMKISIHPYLQVLITPSGQQVPVSIRPKIPVKVFLGVPVTIPPRSGITINARIAKGRDGTVGCVIPVRDLISKTNVALANCITRVDNRTVTISLANMSKHRVRLHASTHVGFFHIVNPDEILPVPDEPEMNLDSADAEVNNIDPELLQPKGEMKREPSSAVKEAIKVYDFSKSKMTPNQIEIFRKFLMANADCFAVDTEELGSVNIVKHRIDTGNAAPIKSRPYRTSRHEEGIQEEQIKSQLDADVIQPSTSPWAFPVVMVPKPDGTPRFCVDYRALNKITKKDVYPLPRINDMLDNLGGAKFMTAMDMLCGYWQVEVDPADREKTAFICKYGLFEYKKMPFGLSNAPATFQRLMDHLISGLQWKVAMVYLDDLIVYSKTFEDHLKHLQEIFSRMREVGLTAKLQKCKFCLEELPYLGHVVSSKGVAVDSNKTKAVEERKPPTTIEELRTFLGLASYYRRFVKDFANIAAPLNALLQKGRIFNWTEECDLAFQTLKQKLISPPILTYPDFEKPFILYTDASNYALGAVLSQSVDNREVVISYASRGLSNPEKNYSVTEQECLAVVWAVEYFRPYLYGNAFQIITDHSALKWLLDLKRAPNGRLARWQMRLQDYDYTINHRAGASHGNADALSRPVLNLVETRTSSQLRDRQTIIHEQWADPKLAPIMAYIKRGEIHEQYKIAKRVVQEAHKYYMKSGMLYIKPDPDSKIRVTEGRLVVPKSLTAQIIHSAHDSLMGGHLGIEKTFHKVYSRYYWDGMRQQIINWVLSCASCNVTKSPRFSFKVPLRTISSSKPFEIVAVDVLGGLPLTTAGNQYILVFTDHFTRYVEIVAVSHHDATTFANVFVERIICHHGAPEQLLSDCEASFLSKIAKAIYDIMEIKKIDTVPYRPQANGLVEKFNQTLIHMLSIYCRKEHKDWDLFLPYIQFAYNSSIHASTGETPFFLTHGRDPILPSQIRLQDTLLKKSQTLSQYKTSLTKGLSHYLQIVRSRLDQIRVKREQKAQSGSYPFQKNDMVWWKLPPQSGTGHKLNPRWDGPYKIVDLDPPSNAFIMKLKGGNKRQRKVHMSQLKRCHVGQTIETVELPSLDSDNSDQ